MAEESYIYCNCANFIYPHCFQTNLLLTHSGSSQIQSEDQRQFQHKDNGQQGEFFTLNDAGQRIAEISYVWRNENTIVADHIRG